MIGVLADISRLNRGRITELVLDGKIPLIGDGRPIVRIGEVDADSAQSTRPERT